MQYTVACTEPDGTILYLSRTGVWRTNPGEAAWFLSREEARHHGSVHAGRAFVVAVNEPVMEVASAYP